jgi:hypothetical protein
LTPWSTRFLVPSVRLKYLVKWSRCFLYSSRLLSYLKRNLSNCQALLPIYMISHLWISNKGTDPFILRSILNSFFICSLFDIRQQFWVCLLRYGELSRSQKWFKQKKSMIFLCPSQLFSSQDLVFFYLAV